MDRGEVTALALLDLSAAFDTIDHQVLLERLFSGFGIGGVALNWFASYLNDRQQRVKLLDVLSGPVSLKYGVPQGSVLGPILFTLYTSPLSSLISEKQVSHHLYADDTQIYVSFSVSNAEKSIEHLKSCLSDIASWMTDSRLKLNPSKTEFLLIGSSKHKSKFSNLFPIKLLNNDTVPSSSARNLGVVFDEHLNYKEHLSQIYKNSFYQIRDLRRIRKHLTLASAKTIAYSLIHSRLDYCNSLLYGLPQTDLMKLQRVQNSLARAVCKGSKFCSARPLLKKLHWLPIEQRIKFKICTFVYKAHFSKQPAYLCDLLTPVSRSRMLRSSVAPCFVTPMVKTRWGTRSFGVAGPSIWNCLQQDIRNSKSIGVFKKSLKTHFFGEAYPS